MLLGALSWLGWTLLGGISTNLIIGLVWQSGWRLSLLPEPDVDTVAGGTLQWLQLFASPFAGNLMLRRLVHTGARWERGPDTTRGWILLLIAGFLTLSGLLYLTSRLP